MDQSDPSPPPAAEPSSSGRSSMAGLVVVGALLSFGALLFLANFTGQVAPPDGRFHEADRAKAKASKSKIGKVPDAELKVVAPPFERPKAPEGAKNLVVVVTTGLRRDHVTPYGAPPDATPKLQELASTGVRFADLVTASPFSRTAAVALFTGQHAATLDMVEPADSGNHRVLGDDVQTLAESLRAAGWGTYGATANFNLNTESGLAQGFDRYWNAHPQGFNPAVRIEGDKVVKRALTLLGERDEAEAARPFYLQVDLVDTHPPQRPIPEQLAAFSPDQPNAVYRLAVHRLDGFVAELLAGLASQGHTPATDTVVVVVGDHGEGNEQPAHHGKMHGRLLFESSVSVPWLVAGPGLPANRIIGGLASSTDFTPTVLELMGLSAPKGIDGRSWAEQIKGGADRTTRERAFSDTWYFTANRASIWTDRMMCQKDFGSHDLEDAFADGCYDRRTDPDFTDLKSDDALMAELLAWRAEVTTHVTARTTPEDRAAAEGGGEDEDAGEP